MLDTVYNREKVHANRDKIRETAGASGQGKNIAIGGNVHNPSGQQSEAALY